VSNAYRLTLRARDDMIALAHYSLVQWGERRTSDYLQSLEDRFGWIAEHPDAGVDRSELFEGLRSFPHQSHIIFYRRRDAMIEIIAVIHHRRDVDAVLSNDRL